jgi:LysR family hydrogen peroxide-inducible transcriptional activator
MRGPPNRLILVHRFFVSWFPQGMAMSDAIFDPRATGIPVLRYLVAVAEHRHFGQAAAACQVSQPTLSALVAQWEKRMGCVVFERDPKGVRLTPAGERIVAAAQHALAALAAVEAAAVEAKPPFFGPVRLGVIPTVGPYALPFVVPALQEAFPDLELPIREGTTADLTAALDGGRLDVALLALLPGMGERYGVAELYVEPFLAALPRRHRLAAATTVDATELTNDELLLLDEGHCLREQALAVCRQRPSSGSGADFRATSLETLRQIVASGGGVTLLPALAAGPEDPRLVLRPVLGAPFRTVGLLWRCNDSRREAYASLSGPIRRHLPKEQVRLA